VDKGLDVKWEKLELTKEEEEATIVVNEKVLIKKIEEIELSILRKLLTQNNCNISVIKVILKNIWKLEKAWLSMSKIKISLSFNSSKEKKR